MPKDIQFAYKHQQALTVAYSIGACLKDTTNEAQSDVIPPRGVLSHVEVEIAAIAAGATSLTWFLAWDAAGDRPLTPATTSTITVGASGGALGGVVALIGLSYKVPDDWVEAKMYFVAKTNAGTCTASTRVFVEE